MTKKINGKQFPVNIIYDDKPMLEKIEKRKAIEAKNDKKDKISAIVVSIIVLLVSVYIVFTFSGEWGQIIGLIFATGFAGLLLLAFISSCGYGDIPCFWDEQGRDLPECIYHNKVFGKEIIDTELILSHDRDLLTIIFTTEDNEHYIEHTTINIRNVVEKKDIEQIIIDLNENIAYLPYVPPERSDD